MNHARMRQAAISAFLTLVAPGVADAADLPLKAPPAEQTHNWTGCYLGVEAGGGWERTQPVAVAGPAAIVGHSVTNPFSVTGALYGGTVGCNYQISNFVVGVENDMSWSTVAGGGPDIPPFTSGTGTTIRENWIDTLRGRAGIAFDRFLLYATGGAALSDASVGVCRLSCSTDTQTRLGWSAGLGAEFVVWNADGHSVTLKLEYLHADFGNVLFFNPPIVTVASNTVSRTAELSDEIFRVGLNWNFTDPPRPAPSLVVKAPPSSPEMLAWTGPYAGGDFGGAWTTNTATWIPLPAPRFFGVNVISGGNGGDAIVGGVHAGYDAQAAQTWVMGIEGDWMATGAHGAFTQAWSAAPPFFFPGPIPGTFTTMSSRLDWVSSLRGRLGYLARSDTLVYATGGAAVAEIAYAANNFNGATYATSAEMSDLQVGFTVGGGVELALNKNWTLRAEYLYYRFNGAPDLIGRSPNFPGFPSSYSWSNTGLSVVRGGVSYKF